MVDFVAWGMVDHLTVEQAACLWAGYDPPTSSTDSRLESEMTAIAPFYQSLVTAIASGQLQADYDPDISRPFGSWKRIIVKRADLMAFAESHNQRPAFLFDTMLKSGSKKSKSEPAPDGKNKGGRPPLYDWDTFYLEIIRIANTPDGLPETQAELAKIMRAWFIARTDDHPERTILRERIRPIYQYLDRYRKPGAE